MKILKKGKQYKIKCHSCDSWLEFGKEDIKTKRIYISYLDNIQLDHEKDFMYICCPVCNKWIPDQEVSMALRGDYAAIWARENSMKSV